MVRLTSRHVKITSNQSLAPVGGAVTAWGVEAPFSRGVNLSNWLQASSAQNVHFAKFGRTDFAQIQQLGCDVVRLPINLHAMTSGPPDYRIDPLLYDFLDQIADWADELGAASDFGQPHV